MWAFIGWIGALIASFVTYLFTAKHYKKQKYFEFNQKRLDEFYGPMVGILKKIKANIKTRQNVYKAEKEAWQDICKNPPAPSDKDYKPFKKSHEYEEEKFKNEDIPAYDEMLRIFEDKKSLAYPSTKKWFNRFSEYVDHWHRPLPWQVLEKIDIKESEFEEFYTDLENRADSLVKKLSGE